MIRLKLDSFLRQGEAYHAGATVLGDGVDLQLHTHDFFEVCWVAGGAGVHRLNGASTRVGPGDLAFIGPDDAHALKVPSGQLSLRNIAFFKRSAGLVRGSLDGADAARLFAPERLAGKARVSPVLLARLNAAFDEMAILPRTSVRLHAFLFDLINRLLSDSIGSRDGVPPPHWLARAVESLPHAPATENKGLAQFYRSCGRCQEHVARECRKHYNMTPSELLNRHRLSKAASLLATTEKSILEIAMDCGWNNLGHFYDLFKKAYGATPKSFRQATRSTLPRSG